MLGLPRLSLLSKGSGMIRKKGFRYLGLVAVLCSLVCRPTDQGGGEAMELSPLFNALLVVSAEQGNCVISHRQGSQLGILKCSRANSLRCQNDVLFDQSGYLIVTTSLANRYRSEFIALLDSFPECKNEIGAASVNPGVTKKSQQFENQVPEINQLHTVDSCDSLSNTNLSKLATREEYDFLISATGLVAKIASTTSNSACLNKIVSGWERSTAIKAANGTILLETSCFYGSSAVTNICNATEKANAFSFDFTLPL